MKKRILALIVLAAMMLAACNQASSGATQPEQNESPEQTSESPLSYENMTATEIAASLTVEEKAYQMVMPAVYNIDMTDMQRNDYGSSLSTFGLTELDAKGWSETIDNLQEKALDSKAGIPFIYGQDSVHGVNYCLDTVIFPHNINIGMANDLELTYEMGLAVADEMKLSQMVWNFAPCVAVSGDPRWGRTYESYSSDTGRVKELSAAFVKGQLDGGVIVCPKHYIGDGSVQYGTGETSSDGIRRTIDRGNAILSDSEIQAQLEIYKTLIDNGAQTIMISHSALNGVKMHENAEYITGVLRNELGFEGLIVSDWNSIQNIESTDDYKEQIIIAVNAGIDLLMEPDSFEECASYLVEAVEEGSISEERMNEAVTRIIQMKKDAGLFDDPYFDQIEVKQSETGSPEYRELARTLAEESLVLIQNENNILPLQVGTKIFVTGPAADDTGVLCGGWTRQWMGMTDSGNNGRKLISDATTILEGLEELAEEYQLTIITDKNKAEEADIVLLCIGEIPYAEWYGDSEDLSLTGELGLYGNAYAIRLAAELDKPTVALIVAGRNLIIEDYREQWDGIVMCGLPGSEGDAVGNVLTGKAPFSGTLSMPWYSSIEDIETGKHWLDVGFGLRYD